METKYETRVGGMYVRQLHNGCIEHRTNKNTNWYPVPYSLDPLYSEIIQLKLRLLQLEEK